MRPRSNRIRVLMKRDTREVSFLFLCHVGKKQNSGCLQPKKRILSTNQVGWHINLGLSELLETNAHYLNHPVCNIKL